MFSLSPILSFKDGTLLCLRMSILDYVFLLEGKLASWCPGRHTTLIDHPSHEEAKNNRTQLLQKGQKHYGLLVGFSSHCCKDLHKACKELQHSDDLLFIIMIMKLIDMVTTCHDIIYLWLFVGL